MTTTETDTMAHPVLTARSIESPVIPTDDPECSAPQARDLAVRVESRHRVRVPAFVAAFVSSPVYYRRHMRLLLTGRQRG